MMIKTNILEVIAYHMPEVIRTGYFECNFRERTYKTAMSFNYDVEVDVRDGNKLEVLVADNIFYYVYRHKKVITLQRILRKLRGE
jgi:hypothetical protein